MISQFDFSNTTKTRSSESEGSWLSRNRAWRTCVVPVRGFSVISFTLTPQHGAWEDRNAEDAFSILLCKIRSVRAVQQLSDDNVRTLKRVWDIEMYPNQSKFIVFYLLMSMYSTSPLTRHSYSGSGLEPIVLPHRKGSFLVLNI